MRQYFGVEPIDQQKLRTKIEDFSLSVEADEISQSLNRIKPEIFSLRERSDSDGQDFTKLRSLDISLCKSIDAIAEYDGVKVEFNLKPWEWLLDGNVAYILEGEKRKSLSLSSQLLADAIGEILATIFRIERGGEFSRIIACPREERIPLLEKMLGEESSEIIQAVHEKWDEWAIEEDDDHVPEWSPADNSDKSDDILEPDDSDDGISLEGLGDFIDIPADTSNPKVTGPVHVEPVDHVPVKKRKKIKFRVKKTPKTRNGKPMGKRTVNPERCEKIAIEFEQAQEQNRFPVSVA